MNDHDDHDDRVRAQFRDQATTFDQRGFATRGLDWIIDTIAPTGTETVLDVACGAAHLGRALAPSVAYVHGLDLVPEMLKQAQRLAHTDDVRNLALLRGDATALPWIDRQFDLVVCRLALHQVADPAAVLSEMARVTKTGGRIAAIDMVADPDPAIGDRTNRLERLRDPSHRRTLSTPQVLALIESTGATIHTTATQDQPLDLEDWLDRTQTPPTAAAEIRRELNREMLGGDPTGLRPSQDPGGIVSFVHPWLVAVATMTR